MVKLICDVALKLKLHEMGTYVINLKREVIQIFPHDQPAATSTMRAQNKLKQI